MSIQISEYQTASKNDTCKRCGSTSVMWWKDSSGSPHLAELFELDGEEVYNEVDHHLRYCPNPIIVWKKKESENSPLQRKMERQIELDLAAQNFMDDDSEQGEPKKDEIQTDGHPYCCTVCGQGVIDQLGGDGLRYNYHDEIVGTTHTCVLNGERSGLEIACSTGTKRAIKTKFLAISERMEAVHGMLQDYKDDIEMNPDDENAKELAAEYGAEYLMLRKRLYTEIPH